MWPWGSAIACAVRRSEKLLHSLQGFKGFILPLDDIGVVEIYWKFTTPMSSALCQFFQIFLTPMSSGHGLIRIGCGDFFCIILKNHFHMNLNNSQPTTPMSWGVSGEHVQPCMETWCWLVNSQLLCHDASSIQTAQSCNDAFLLAVHPRSKYSYVMRSCCYMWPHRRP